MSGGGFARGRTLKRFAHLGTDWRGTSIQAALVTHDRARARAGA